MIPQARRDRKCACASSGTRSERRRDLHGVWQGVCVWNCETRLRDDRETMQYVGPTAGEAGVRAAAVEAGLVGCAVGAWVSGRLCPE